MTLRPPTSTLFPYTTLFRSRNFTVTNISTLLIYGALYVTFYYLGLFQQGTLGYTAAAAGAAGIPGSIFLIFFSPRFGSLAADRKSTRLNSSHANISYAVFCLNDPPTTDIYTLSLHDALPISQLHRHEHLDPSHLRCVVRHVLLPRSFPAGNPGLHGGRSGRGGNPGLDLSDLLLAEIWEPGGRSEEHTSELQSRQYLVCRLLLE